MAIAGLLPELPGWELPATELHGLPVLLMLESEAPPPSSRRTIAELTRRGGAVQVARVRGVDRLPERATPLVAAWIQSRHARRRAPALASPEEASYGSE